MHIYTLWIYIYAYNYTHRTTIHIKCWRPRSCPAQGVPLLYWALKRRCIIVSFKNINHWSSFSRWTSEVLSCSSAVARTVPCWSDGLLTRFCRTERGICPQQRCHLVLFVLQARFAAICQCVFQYYFRKKSKWCGERTPQTWTQFSTHIHRGVINRETPAYNWYKVSYFPRALTRPTSYEFLCVMLLIFAHQILIISG